MRLLSVYLSNLTKLTAKLVNVITSRIYLYAINIISQIFTKLINYFIIIIQDETHLLLLVRIRCSFPVLNAQNLNFEGAWHRPTRLPMWLFQDDESLVLNVMKTSKVILNILTEQTFIYDLLNPRFGAVFREGVKVR